MKNSYFFAIFSIIAGLCASGCADFDCENGQCIENYGVNPEFSVSREALTAQCSISVVGYGSVAMETDYVPNVTWCENGNAPTEALKAQSAAARTFAYYKISSGGTPVNNSQGDQVYKCTDRTPSAAQLQKCQDATNATSGYVMTYKGTITAGFYVSGSKGACLNSNCDYVGNSSSSCYVSQQKYVTYNWGKSGNKANGFTQTSLGWVNDGNYANRGCMSQNGASCLSNIGWEWQNILKYFYGADINIEKASGTCVTETKKCETTLSKSGTIIDEEDPCFSKAASESWYNVNSGYNNHLYYTYVWDKAAEAVGTWTVNVTRPGTYEVFAYIQSGVGAVSEKAPYTIRASGKNNNVAINLSGKSGWVSLGKYTFASGGDQYVKLSDASGEPYTDKNGKRILFDAIKFEDAQICTNACTEGATQCSGNGVQKCTKGSNGCTSWGAATACGSNQVCSAGKCIASCTNACTEGAKQCSGNGVQTCTKGSNGCTSWGTASACGSNQVCDAGKCVASCSNECSENGARECSGQGYRICADLNSDGCLEWSSVKNCSANETCSKGACVGTEPACTDECSEGSIVCAGNVLKKCGQYDDDSCLEYNEVECEAGTVCRNNQCIPEETPCESSCMEDTVKCDGNGYVTCSDTNGDGCYEWSSERVECLDNEACVDGECQPVEEEVAECLTEIDGRPSVIIDDSDGCFTRNASYDWSVGDGYGYNDYLYYAGVSNRGVDAVGRWTLNVTKGGDYTIYAYVESGFGSVTENAPFVVRASGENHKVSIDMTKASGWIKLGDFSLKKGVNQYVELTNETGESSDSRKRVLFDAIKVVPNDEDVGEVEMDESRDPGLTLLSPSCSGIPQNKSTGAFAAFWILGIAGGIVWRRRKSC